MVSTRLDVLDPELGQSFARCRRRSAATSGLDLATETLEGRRGDDALGRAAHAHVEVVAGSAHRRRHAGGDVAVGDEADAGAGGAQLLDQLGVAGPVEHDGGDVAQRRRP